MSSEKDVRGVKMADLSNREKFCILIALSLRLIVLSPQPWSHQSIFPAVENKALKNWGIFTVSFLQKEGKRLENMENTKTVPSHSDHRAVLAFPTPNTFERNLTAMGLTTHRSCGEEAIQGWKSLPSPHTAETNVASRGP